MKTPDFFIVGAPRCGTSALFQYLERHPDIFLSSLKEPHFFGSDNLYPRRPTLHQYLSYFSRAKSERRIGEASTSYLFSRNAAREIHAFCPSARIIAMIRNPVDTMYSIHSMVLYYNDEDILDFETALEAAEDRKRGLRWPAKPHILNYLFYRDAVRYTDQIRRYFDVFGRERVKVIVFDDFRSATATVYRDTLEFLDVDANIQTDFRVINQNRSARSQWLQSIIQGPRLLRWRERHLPQSVDELVFGALRGLNSSSTPRPPMPAALRRKLRDEFAPEVDRLSELLRRDLTHWYTE